MYKNKKDRDGAGKPSKEYYRIIQAKKRLVDLYSETFEGTLLFPILIQAGRTSVGARENFGIYHLVERTPKLDNFQLYFDDVKGGKDFGVTDEFRRHVNNKVCSLQVEFVQEIFTETRMERLFREIFRHNHEGEEILTEDQVDYYANIATLMVRTGIDQLMKFLDVQYGRLLHQELERVKEISSIIQYQKDRKLHTWI